jgi:hypothetical protein
MCVYAFKFSFAKRTPKNKDKNPSFTCDTPTHTHTRNGIKNTAIYLNAQIIVFIVKKTRCFFTIFIHKENLQLILLRKNSFRLTYIRTFAFKPTFLAAETKPSVHL